MSLAAALVRLLPLSFMGRLGLALTEITLAVVVVSGSVIVGHELKAWRAWFWDPATYHPWAPTPTPLAAAATSAPLTADPSGVTTCRPLEPNERLVFVKKFIFGADCVRTVERNDGFHVMVETYPGAMEDLGVVSLEQELSVRVFAPTTWPSPVLVLRGTWAGTVGSAVVVTWKSREPTRLLAVVGEKVEVSMGSGGWPRLAVTSVGGPRRVYVWTGGTFSAQ